jgi:hypothetical protein
MQVTDIDIEDYHDLINALMDGDSVPAVASFRIDWTMSRDKHRFHDVPDGWDANVVFNSATCEWRARTDFATFVSDPATTSTSPFAEVGHERDGVFF